MTASKNLMPNLAAFLDMIAYSEGTTKYGNEDGYNVIVGGELFTSYKDHPKKMVKLEKLNICSTAAGRYQILYRYYRHYKELLLLPDFSPHSQDLIAIQYIKEQKALSYILKGDIKTAIEKCSNIWASFPGAGYKQHENKIEDLLLKYVEFGGSFDGKL
jgi:muramidase (phage lysozyme)